ncbi:META domain-containing protein [Dyadobacter sp. NIV53]|uniref:META domain-containing protein n=1 Tax=Dyadobacter sp. NIV53 TaxID=2861765 RepID=UPI001C84D76E|nr:META domain-containing protein [Dyadobacter sp. NIV53]
MKNILFFATILFVLALSAFQCGKQEDCCVLPPCSDKPTLEGTWRLTGYRDISTGSTENDPGPEGKGVIFTFKDNEKDGSISGHTVMNEVSGSYTLGPGCKLNIITFGGTKVGEPGWSGRAWLQSDSSMYYQRIENSLVIYRNKGREGMVFKKQSF